MSPRRSLERRAGGRKVRARFSIYCEGVQTEKSYFEQIRAWLGRETGNDRTLPIISVTQVPGNPLEIVKHAIDDNCDDRSEDDEIWCVFDVEAPQPHPYIEEAITLAKQQRIHCAVSNPCFELWLLLHFDKYCAGYLTTKEAHSLAEAKIPRYIRDGKRIKNVVPLLDKFPDAQCRAVALENIHDESNISNRNPSTTAWKPVEALLKLKK